MYDRKIIRKTIKYKLTDFAEKYNFKFYKPNVIIRENSDILQIINFDIISGHFNCNIAIQPLYIPYKNLILSFGDRLNYFRTNVNGNWGYGDTQNELNNDLDIVVELLEKNVIDWFNKVNTPMEIIKFFNTKESYAKSLIIDFSEKLQYEFLGFSYLYEGEYQLAKKMFINLIEEYNGSTTDWVVEKVKMLTGLIEKIDNNSEDIPDILKGYIELTRSNLKLK